MKKTICLLLLFAYLMPFTVLAQTNVDGQVKRVEQGSLQMNPKNTNAIEALKKLNTQ